MTLAVGVVLGVVVACYFCMVGGCALRLWFAHAEP